MTDPTIEERMLENLRSIRESVNMIRSLLVLWFLVSAGALVYLVYQVATDDCTGLGC